MSTESFTTNKKERMQEGVSLAQGERNILQVNSLPLGMKWSSS